MTEALQKMLDAVEKATSGHVGMYNGFGQYMGACSCGLEFSVDGLVDHIEETISQTEDAASDVDPIEAIAREFHRVYERMASGLGWETQESTRVEFDDLPEANRDLMLSVVGTLVRMNVIAPGSIRDVLVDLLDALHDERLYLDIHRSHSLTEQARKASAAVGVYNDETDWLDA